MKFTPAARAALEHWTAHPSAPAAEVATAIGASVRSVERWRALDDFDAELEAALQANYSAEIQRCRVLVRKALDVLERTLDGELVPPVRVRAARIVISAAFQCDTADLLRELERMKDDAADAA